MPSARRFPPLVVEEQEACFTVRDESGQALAYVISGRAGAARRLSCSRATKRGASPPTSPCGGEMALETTSGLLWPGAGPFGGERRRVKGAWPHCLYGGPGSFSRPMTPNRAVDAGLLGGLGDAIGGYPEVEQPPAPST